MSDTPHTATTPQLASRARLQLARARALQPAERMAEMQRLIAHAWALLQQHPEGLARFRRRNFSARSIASPRKPRPDGT